MAKTQKGKVSKPERFVTPSFLSQLWPLLTLKTFIFPQTDRLLTI